MIAITVYQSSDGVRFDSAEKCAEYEQLVRAVAEASAPLGPRPDIRHGRWIQRDRDTCLQVKRSLLAIIRKRFKNLPVLNNPDDAIHPMSVVGRVVNDSDLYCLDRAWGRLGCINWTSFREYDQPYFAMHESEAEGPN